VGVGQRFRSSVARWMFMPSTGKTARITVSVGVAEYDRRCAKKPALLVARADEALYQAKSLGGNNVCPYSGPSADDRAGKEPQALQV